MTDTSPTAAATPRRRRRALVAGAIAAPLAFGAVGLSLAQTGTTVTPVEPTAISALRASGAIAARQLYPNVSQATLYRRAHELKGASHA